MIIVMRWYGYNYTKILLIDWVLMIINNYNSDHDHDGIENNESIPNAQHILHSLRKFYLISYSALPKG